MIPSFILTLFGEVCYTVCAAKKHCAAQAGVAELAYAHDSNSCTRKGMRVQFPPSALKLYPEGYFTQNALPG